MSEYEYGLAKDVTVEGSSSSSNQTGSQQPQQPTRKTDSFPATKKSEFRSIFRLD